MKYTVQVREILAKDIEVDAANADEALDKVADMYNDGEIVLDYSDCVYSGMEGDDPEVIGRKYADALRIVDEE